MNLKEQALESVYSDGLVSVAEAASFLGISRSHIYDLMEAGHLGYTKLGRCRRIPRRALTQLALVNHQGGWR